MDWNAWGEEALARARDEERPILLSIGYSACHWCHVMERESFEDPETAALMNERFVCIKLDREERPDLDSIYMEACQAMTGQGGWPLNVFLTPEQVPFFAGTYFPPDSRMGMPSWRSVLDAVAEAWDERRDEIREGGKRVAERLRGGALLEPSDQPLDARALDAAVEALRRQYDRAQGGFGERAQVPAGLGARVPAAAWRDGDDRPHAARHGLGRDVRPGGRRLRALLGRPATGSSPTSRRCSTTTRCWRAPTCTAGRSPARSCSGPSWRRRSTGRCARCADPRAASTPRSTPTPRARRASSTSGPSTSCARRSTASRTRDEAIAWFGATDRGNFEGRNILGARRRASPERRGEWRRRLYEVRAERVWPGLDDKRLSSWNALMISALADAGAVLERDDYLDRRSRGRRVRAARPARRRRAGCCAPGRTARAS